MTGGSFLQLGVRLSFAGGRPAWIRLGLMIGGFALGSGLLLGAMSVVPALDARDARRDILYGNLVSPHRAHDAVLIWSSRQRVGDQAIELFAAEPVGTAPKPPGLPRMPAAGEMFVSEALVRSPAAVARLERRLDVELTGLVDAKAVEDPTTLAAWVAAPHDPRLPLRSAFAVESFAAPDAPGPMDPPDLQSLFALVGACAAVLLPVWLFVATSTRLSSAAREARFAAIRLAGATAGEVRTLVAVEAGGAAAIGALLGVSVFLAMRPLLASGILLDLRFYPADFRPPVVLGVVVLVALPAVAMVMSLVTMRRVHISPLGVTRGVRRRHAGWGWTIVLGVGLSLLAWAASQHEALAARDTTAASVIVFGGLTLTAFGLIGTATWTAWVAARWMATRVSSPAALLGARRLESDPGSVGRVVGGVALLVAIVPVLQAGLVDASESYAGTWIPRWTRALSADTVIVDTNVPGAWRSLPELLDVEGVRSVDVTKRKSSGGTSSYRTGLVRTDGGADSLEEIRRRFAWSADVLSVGELRAAAARDDAQIELRSLSHIVWILTAFLIVVLAATLLVAMVDWIVERRRSLAMLSALGTPGNVLRGSVLTQVALPLITSAVFGVLGACAVVSLLFTAIESDIGVPIRDIAVLAGIVSAAVLVVTALATPWIRVTRSPALLRAE